VFVVADGANEDFVCFVPFCTVSVSAVPTFPSQAALTNVARLSKSLLRRT